jgi:hypothetical protein
VSDYQAFLAAKAQLRSRDGFEPTFLPDWLFDFQRALVEWSVCQGRAALFADCGLGKGPMALVWAENVVRHTNGRVLILAPLAVSHQFVREAEKFGLELARSSDGRPAGPITVTNYERLHLFDPADFTGVVCDESSILKAFDGVRRGAITRFMRRCRYRLLATATAAPNDYIELGTSSEALGYLGHTDMLTRFFKNDAKVVDPKGRRLWRKVARWRLKGHADEPFWRWVCSWARAIRRPSDMGFGDGAFVLPGLTQREHLVEMERPPDGMLFPLPAVDLGEQREERRRTLAERCQRVAELVDHDRPALVWCHMNAEGDRLAKLIPGAVEVAGSDPDEAKEEKLLAFQGGEARVLVTKPKIGAWGLNLQHCSHVTFFPTHSYEAFYQGVRRCWRFGQKNPVMVDIVTTEGERGVLENLQRKAEAADRMFTRLVALMHEHMDVEHDDGFTHTVRMPEWLSQTSA